MKPTATTNLVPGLALGAQRGFAATFNWMLNFCLNLTGADGVEVDRKDSDHPYIRLTSQSRGNHPWLCRFHTTEDDTDGHWEIYLPPGCMSVGANCSPMNLPAAEIEGHENDADGWFALPVDETQPPTSTTTDGDVTTTEQLWEVVAHGKTSAKIYGVDDLNALPRRLLYVSVRRIRSAGEEEPTAEETAEEAAAWGDEFAQTVAHIAIRKTTKDGTTTVSRQIAQNVAIPVSVAGRTTSELELIWYLSLDASGTASVEKVYCRFAGMLAIGGMAVSGPPLTEVTDAESTIFAKIETSNMSASSVGVSNVLSVVMDVSPSASDEFVLLLPLYNMAYNTVLADLRAQSLVNALTYR